MPKARTPKAEKPEKKEQYSLTLQIADDVYAVKGKTIVDAITKLKPTTIKARGVFTLKFGKMESQSWLYPPQLRKLLVSKMHQEMFAKRLTVALH